MAGDTSTYHFTESRFGDVMTVANNLVPYDTASATDPQTGITHAYAKKYDFAYTYFQYSLGHATLYFDANGHVEAMADDYDFGPTHGQFIFIAVTQAMINGAVGDKHFLVHYP